MHCFTFFITFLIFPFCSYTISLTLSNHILQYNYLTASLVINFVEWVIISYFSVYHFVQNWIFAFDKVVPLQIKVFSFPSFYLCLILYISVPGCLCQVSALGINLMFWESLASHQVWIHQQQPNTSLFILLWSNSSNSTQSIDFQYFRTESLITICHKMSTFCSGNLYKVIYHEAASDW